MNLWWLTGAEMNQYGSAKWTTILLCGFCWPNLILAQEEPVTQSSTEQTISDRRENEPRKAPCFEALNGESSKQIEETAFASLPEIDKAWLTEDVADIITAEERCAFLKLESDEESGQFVEQFWLRRSPYPDVLHNDFKEEHYRRMVVADEKFATETPGWKTDRGRVYVLFGPPDRIESHASGEPTGRLPEEGSETTGYAWEKWHYKYLEGVGEDVDLEFVDVGGSEDYRLSMSPQERNFLLLPHAHGWVDWKDYEPMQFASSYGSDLVVGIAPTRAPQVKFKGLEAMVVSRIIRDQVYFSCRVEYVRATQASTVARIVVDIPEDKPSNSDVRAPRAVEVFGRISKPSGWVVDTFERSGSMS